MKRFAIFSIALASLGLLAISAPKAMACDQCGNNWNRSWNNSCSDFNRNDFGFRFRNNDNFRFRGCDNFRFRDRDDRNRRDHRGFDHGFRLWR